MAIRACRAPTWLRWIEDIPFSETRNYVQRVVENAMVYDIMNPDAQPLARPDLLLSRAERVRCR